MFGKIHNEKIVGDLIERGASFDRFAIVNSRKIVELFELAYIYRRVSNSAYQESTTINIVKGFEEGEKLTTIPLPRDSVSCDILDRKITFNYHGETLTVLEENITLNGYGVLISSGNDSEFDIQNLGGEVETEGRNDSVMPTIYIIAEDAIIRIPVKFQVLRAVVTAFESDGKYFHSINGD